MKFCIAGKAYTPGEAKSQCRGVAKLVKAPDFDSGMRGFESFLPCQKFPHFPPQQQVHDEQP